MLGQTKWIKKLSRVYVLNGVVHQNEVAGRAIDAPTPNLVAFNIKPTEQVRSEEGSRPTYITPSNKFDIRIISPSNLRSRFSSAHRKVDKFLPYRQLG
jgi:hypothetical protein